MLSDSKVLRLWGTTKGRCHISFKQKKAYGKRISDWSSDVCSSDLQPAGEVFRLISRQRDFTAILAGIARAGDEGLVFAERERCAHAEAHGRHHAVEPAEYLDRLRPLQGDQPAVFQILDLAAFEMASHMGDEIGRAHV